MVLPNVDTAPAPEPDFLHDLSNPVAAALFWSELLSENRLPDPALGIHKIHVLLLEIREEIEARRLALSGAEARTA